jgi:hypothetical protein
MKSGSGRPPSPRPRRPPDHACTRERPRGLTPALPQPASEAEREEKELRQPFDPPCGDCSPGPSSTAQQVERQREKWNGKGHSRWRERERGLPSHPAPIAENTKAVGCSPRLRATRSLRAGIPPRPAAQTHSSNAVRQLRVSMIAHTPALIEHALYSSERAIANETRDRSAAVPAASA